MLSIPGLDGLVQNRPSRVADGHQQETQVAEALLEQIGEIYGNVCCLRYIAKSQNKERSIHHQSSTYTARPGQKDEL